MGRSCLGDELVNALGFVFDRIVTAPGHFTAAAGQLKSAEDSRWLLRCRPAMSKLVMLTAS
jgi:hypothetical protein